MSVKEPRYYQRTAINRAVQGILRGDQRLLLTMATGTGKTFVAMQIVWKLWNVNWRAGRNPRILYLADRNVLVDQPIEREFKPAFGTGEGSPIWKLRGEAKLGREIYFGLYQQLADSAAGLDGMYRDFAPDFFDLVIVDECHRGSARADSAWRAILEYFASATQLGMTATPKRDESVDTYNYFGGSIFEYSLAQGIEDGFLAPYRVRRVVLSPSHCPDQASRASCRARRAVLKCRAWRSLRQRLHQSAAALVNPLTVNNKLRAEGPHRCPRPRAPASIRRGGATARARTGRVAPSKRGRRCPSVSCGMATRSPT